MNNNAGKLPILEIFYSIQGEGTFMGAAVTFIRIAGCNLRCPWCDTKTSWDASEGNAEITWSLPTEVADFCGAEGRVVITGGEPLMYPETAELIGLLHRKGLWVAIETNGTFPTPTGIEKPDWVTASPKPPEYKLHEGCYCDEVKFVISSELDNIVKFQKTVLPVMQRFNIPCGEDSHCWSVPVWLQPDGYNMEASAQWARELVMCYPEQPSLRLGIQLHKIFQFR